jgi:Uma2 family endonuclease
MKVAAANKHDFFYPDVVVTCGEADRQERDQYILHEPLLIIEVLSPSTANHDLWKKFGYYQDIPSMREIAFIDLDIRRTTVYLKGADGLWVLHRFDEGMVVYFTSVDLTISAETLFAKIRE